MINLVGPLVDNNEWLIEVLRALLGRDDIIEVLGVDIEYAPLRRSQFMNDMTMIDLFVRCRVGRGILGVVVEFKYADRFSTRKVEIFKNRRYADLLAEQRLWNDEAVLVEHRFNQLARVHALGDSVLAAESSLTHGMYETHLVVVADADDFVSCETMLEYRRLLARPCLASHHSLKDLIELIHATAPNAYTRRLFDDAKLRYVSFYESEYLTV